MIQSRDLDFSFSGLKTAVLYAVREETEKAGTDGKASDKINDTYKKGLCREFEQAVTDVLDSKLRAALEKTSAQSLIIGGGVSANHFLRKTFKKTADEYGIPLFLPSHHISGDNALMIALAGAFHTDKHSKDIRAGGTLKLGR